jgi:hypothetical protein
MVRERKAVLKHTLQTLARHLIDHHEATPFGTGDIL